MSAFYVVFFGWPGLFGLGWFVLWLVFCSLWVGCWLQFFASLFWFFESLFFRFSALWIFRLPFLVGVWFFVESLILAQDERWRRA